MCRQFEAETTEICSLHVIDMLNQFKTDSNKWHAKDAAVSSIHDFKPFVLLKFLTMRFDFDFRYISCSGSPFAAKAAWGCPR